MLRSGQPHPTRTTDASVAGVVMVVVVVVVVMVVGGLVLSGNGGGCLVGERDDVLVPYVLVRLVLHYQAEVT